MQRCLAWVSCWAVGLLIASCSTAPAEETPESDFEKPVWAQPDIQGVVHTVGPAGQILTVRLIHNPGRVVVKPG